MHKTDILVITTLLCLLSISLQDNQYTKKSCKIPSDNENSYSCTLEYNKPVFSTTDHKPIFSTPPITADKIIKFLNLEVSKEGSGKTEGVTHIRVTDSKRKRYEVNREIIQNFPADSPKSQTPRLRILADTLIEGDTNQAIPIVDPKTNITLFTLFKNELVYADDYISFDYSLDTNFVYLLESTHLGLMIPQLLTKIDLEEETYMVCNLLCLLEDLLLPSLVFCF